MHGQQNIKKIGALSWSVTKIILRCTVNKTSKTKKGRSLCFVLCPMLGCVLIRPDFHYKLLSPLKTSTKLSNV